MDGFQEHLKHSIQLRLAWGLSVTITAVALIAGSVSFYTAFREANELQDDILRQVANLVQRQPGVLPQPSRKQDGGVASATTDAHLLVQVLPPRDRPGTGLAQARDAGFPPDLKDGLQTRQMAEERYRVLVVPLPDGRRMAVAQDVQVRDDIALASAMSSVLPLLILVPVLVLLVVAMVRALLRPVTRLAADIDARSEQDVHPLPAVGLPTEVRPFVTAINRLLERVGEAMASQRRFVADAAHELRSPLTALSLQAERLDEADMPDETRQRVRQVRAGIERGRSLLEQLLSLARAQAPERPAAQPVSVRNIYRRVLEALWPLAESRRVDVGMIDGPDALVYAPEVEVFTLVRNLVDNAIRYAPESGRVDLLVRPDGRHAVLEIEDNGPGIPIDERERVLDPFYRMLGTDQPGSGLGLSIVRTIAQRLGGQLELLDASRSTHGLRVRLTLPRVAETPPSKASSDRAA